MGKVFITSQPLKAKGCEGIIFTHVAWLGRWMMGKTLSGLYLRNHRVYTW